MAAAVYIGIYMNHDGTQFYKLIFKFIVQSCTACRHRPHM